MRKNRILPLVFIPLLALLVLAFVFFSTQPEYSEHSFFAMDTFISVKAEVPDDKLLSETEKIICDDEMIFSRTFSKSELAALNASASGEEIPLSEDAYKLLSFSFEVSEVTQGAFSPVLGSLVDLWDIKSKTPRVPSKEEISNALDSCNPSDIIISENGVIKHKDTLKIDLGGVAKGYTSEKAISFLRDNGVENALISFGGSIACIGSAKGKESGWVIGIKNPFDTTDIIGTLSTTNSYIAVSGSYERYFEKDGIRYHHILDTKDGYPAHSDIESSVIISGSGALSDALSTALFVMGFDKALEFYSSGIYDFEAILVLSDGTIYITPGICESFTPNKHAKYKDNEVLKIRQ